MINTKFMKVRRIVIPTLTMAIIASQLLGCAAVSQSELLTMLEKGESIEIEVATPLAEVEQGTEEKLEWLELALKTSNPDLRSKIEESLGIEEKDGLKYGVVYVTPDGEQDNNNTLRVALHNKAFIKALDDKQLSLKNAVLDNYADVEDLSDEKIVALGVNSYFELFADSKDTSAYANADSTITRAEFMAALYRAEAPVSELTANTEFETAVGQNELNIYAQSVVESSYLDIASKSLDNMTYNGTITRAEAVYMVVQRYFSEDIVESTAVSSYVDLKDGGNIAEQQKFIENGTAKNYWKSYELTYALQNPDLGLPTDLYNAMIIAEQKGLLDVICTDNTSRWDEGITKVEAIQLIMEALKQDPTLSTFTDTCHAPIDFTASDKIDVVGPLGPGYRYEATEPTPTVMPDGSTVMVYGSPERPVTSCPPLKPGEKAYFYISGQVILYHGTYTD